MEIFTIIILICINTMYAKTYVMCIYLIIGRAELQILQTIIDEICLKVRHMNSERNIAM